MQIARRSDASWSRRRESRQREKGGRGGGSVWFGQTKDGPSRSGQAREKRLQAEMDGIIADDDGLSVCCALRRGANDQQ